MRSRIPTSTNVILFILLDKKKVDNQVSLPTNPIQPNLTHASTSAGLTPSTPDESVKDTAADRVYKPILPFSIRHMNNNKHAHKKILFILLDKKKWITKSQCQRIQSIPI